MRNVFKRFLRYQSEGVSVFIGVYSAIFQLGLCFMRRLRGKEDFLNMISSTLAASLAIALDTSKARKITLAFFLVLRALHSLFVSLKKTKIVEKWPVIEMVSLVVVNILIWNIIRLSPHKFFGRVAHSLTGWCHPEFNRAFIGSKLRPRTTVNL